MAQPSANSLQLLGNIPMTPEQLFTLGQLLVGIWVGGRGISSLASLLVDGLRDGGCDGCGWLGKLEGVKLWRGKGEWSR